MTTPTPPSGAQGNGPAPTSTARGAHLPNAKGAIQGQRGKKPATPTPPKKAAKRPTKPAKNR
jgi:hypothetical protein